QVELQQFGYGFTLFMLPGKLLEETLVIHAAMRIEQVVKSIANGIYVTVLAKNQRKNYPVVGRTHFPVCPVISHERTLFPFRHLRRVPGSFFSLIHLII